MMIKKLYIVGDVHYRAKEPYRTSKKVFFDWLLNNPEINKEENGVLFLGDIADTPKLAGKENEYIVDAFLNRMKFRTKIVLTGNHDSRRREGNYLEALRPIPGVKIIDRLEEFEIGEVSILALPHYITQKRSDTPLRKYYESLAEDQELSHDYDFIFGHFPEESCSEIMKPINLGGLKGKRIFGDIHKPSDVYLGTPVINRKDEAGKDSRIAVIDVETKNLKYIPVPRILDFYKVDFQDEKTHVIPDNSQFKLLSVENSPSKLASEELAKSLGCFLHEYTTYSEEKIVESSDLEEFNKDKDDFIKTSVIDYANEVNIPKGTLEKLKSVMIIGEKEEVAV